MQWRSELSTSKKPTNTYLVYQIHHKCTLIEISRGKNPFARTGIRTHDLGLNSKSFGFKAQTGGRRPFDRSRNEDKLGRLERIIVEWVLVKIFLHWSFWLQSFCISWWWVIWVDPSADQVVRETTVFAMELSLSPVPFWFLIDETHTKQHWQSLILINYLFNHV